MCGIVGIVERNKRPINRYWLEAMSASLRHRGPDADGFYINGMVGLGMRRLSIIDVDGGSQPIHNEDKTVWVVFNGEIYNYGELRKDLEKRGHRFYTQSDTETLVHLYEEFGEAAISHLRGMFAYALWDEKRRCLILGRDRLGIKPLYYTYSSGRLVFASELKAFLRLPGFKRELSPRAVQLFLTYLYIPGPDTIFQGIKELPPAHYLIYDDAGQMSLHRYWTLSFKGIEGLPEAEWRERFMAQFRESVQSHLISDVPLGAFLSGGIDSSAIVGVMAQASSKPIETFTIGYDGKSAFQDERHYARIVASHFGTHHHEFVVSPNITDLLPKLVACFDQPFADSSAIPNFYISKMTRRHVTVALSGLGGDEIGGGYERYLGMLWGEPYRRLPRTLRRHLSQSIVRLPDASSGRPWADRLKRFVSSAEMEPPDRYAALVTAFTPEERRDILAADFQDNAKPDTCEQVLTQMFSSQNGDSLMHYLMLADIQLYLPGDLLTLTDRVSMLHSLEVRVPFLDHPLVELMAKVPSQYKISLWTKKILLKKAFADLLPQPILRRKKLGFSVPLALWLRTNLKATMREILSSHEVTRIGYLNNAEVQRTVAEHLGGQANHENKLWALMNLVCWHRLVLDSANS